MSASSISLNKEASESIRQMSNSLKFRSYLFIKMPIAWIAGLRLEQIDGEQAVASMPYRWLSQNPFRSIYFATQAMAAELSTGALALAAVRGRKPSVAMLITGLEAEFVKKADSKVYFTCSEGSEIFAAVERAVETGEGQQVKVHTEGRMQDGTVVSRFSFTWSFKARKN
jgi:hypothetical protein